MPEPSSPKQLRSFGLIVAGGFFVIAMVPLLRGHAFRPWALIVAAVFLIPALAVPASLRYPYKGWMFIGHCLGWVNTRIILTALFYIVFTPASIVMRLMKRDTMNRSFEPELETYRVAKNPRPSNHLKHQF